MLKPFLITGVGILLAACIFAASRQQTHQFKAVITGHDNTWVNNYAHARISMIPEKGWFIKPDAPVKISIKHTQNIELSQTELTIKDVRWGKKVKSANFDILIKGKKVGIAEIDADLVFSTCNKSVCIENTGRLTKTIIVKP